MKTRLTALICLLVLLAAPAAAKTDLQPAGPVSDFAGILPAEDTNRLTDLISETERKTGAEIAVVTVRSLDGKNLEDFAGGLFNDWGIGKKGKDNGVLILVAVAERKIRIEVGYGLEGVLPDGKCGEIIRNVLTPAFRKNAYGDGLYQATALISGIIGGENPQIPESKPLASGQSPLPFTLFWVGFCVLFTFLAAGFVGLAIQIVYLLALASGVFLIPVLNPAWKPLSQTLANPGFILAVPFAIAWLGGFFGLALNSFRLNRIKKRYRNDWRSHWYWWYGLPPGSGGGGFGGSGGFSGGGFGGGCSGGGGASGGW